MKGLVIMEQIEFVLDLLNTFIDDHINMYGYTETIEYLIDLGCTKDLLVKELEFDEDDVAEAFLTYYEKNKDYE